MDGPRRLMYWPPWGVTRPWLPRVACGGDEYGNPSVFINGPLTGALIVFYSRTLSFDLEDDDGP